MKLLRKIGTTVTACFVAFNVFAQSTEVYQTSVYFESGKAVLDETAQAEILQFVQKISQLHDFELDIRAYTDDIGTAQYNAQLATNRADMVRRFLADRRIEAFETKVQGMGEVALGDTGNPDEARRQNRRVDIRIAPFQPQSLSDFYGYFQRRHTQSFTIRPDRDTTLLGAKGTVLFVPAGSFQTADGKAISGQVTVELQEAYSYQDMLLHNLATVSNGEMLETGGMVHIAARLQGGQELEVKKGRELQLSMPVSEVKDDGMKLFTADRAGNDPAAPINWTTNGTSFIPNSFQVEEPFFNFAAVKIEPMALIEPLQLPAFPKALPAAPVMPAKPYLSPDVAPTLEALAATYPKEKGESESEYQARLQARLASAQRSHEQKMEANAKNMQRYEAALKVYEAELAAYQQTKAIYEQEVADFTAYLQAHQTDIQKWAESFDWAKKGFLQKVVNVVKQTDKLGDYRDYLVQQCQRFGLNEEARNVQGVALLETNDLLKDMARKFIRCANTSAKLYESRISTGADAIARQIGETRLRQVEVFSTGIADVTKQETSLEDIYKTLQNYQAQASLFNEIIANYNEVVEKAGFFEQAQKLDHICKGLTPTYDQVLEKQLEKSQDLQKTQQLYLRTVGLDRLGWINCDRLFGGGERMLVQVPCEVNGNTSFFLVFENIRSVMGLMGSRDKGIYMVGGIPKGQRVKLIGLRIVEGKAEIAIKEGLVDEIHQKAVEFRPAKLSELRDLLNV